MRNATPLAFAALLVGTGGCTIGGGGSGTTPIPPGGFGQAQLQCTSASEVPNLPRESNPIPPISGGTLLVTRDGRWAIAADAERDQVGIVDLQRDSLRGTIVLETGDEPGRVVEDGAGRVYVALRRAGQVVMIDPVRAVEVGRFQACPAPRGLAWDRVKNQIYVACAGGELVTQPLDGRARATTVMVAPDLRDIVLQDGKLLISQFRSANLLTVDPSGRILGRSEPAGFQSTFVRNGAPFTPSVAWRTVPFASGALMLHQRGTTATIVTNPSVAAIGGPIENNPGPDGTIGGVGGGGGGDSYSGGGNNGGGGEGMGVLNAGGCGGAIVHSTITLFNEAAPLAMGQIPSGVVTTDVAVSPDNSQIAIVAAGNTGVAGTASVMLLTLSDLANIDGSACLPLASGVIGGQPIAAAWSGHQLLVQTRNPSMVMTADFSGSGGTLPVSVTLADDSRFDAGHGLFHANSGGGIACAMCHPEGGDDGRTWHFDFGARRTVALRGGILGTEPFHWNGDLSTMMDLTNEIFVRRMGGQPPSCEQIGALQSWVDTIPTLAHAAPADPDAVARGAQLFHDPVVACASCHSGPKLTNNTTVDVGGGLPLQVPRLVGLLDRAPYLHDGCASTLRDRFGACGSEQHGHTADLTPAQIDDLVAFLQTL